VILGRRIWIWRLGSNRYGILILRIQHRSDGTGGKGVDGGGAGRRETLSRGGASPERLESGVLGVESSWVLAVEHRHGIRSPLASLSLLVGVRGGESKGGGGSARWRITSARVRVVLGLDQECKACARALCSTGEPVRDSCGAVRGCRRLASVLVPGVLYQP